MKPDIISALIDGALVDPDGDGKSLLRVPTRRVAIAGSLDGMEADLINQIECESPYAVVSDPRTHAVLGSRIERALESIGTVIAVRLGERPHADMQTADALAAQTSRAGALVAVGSGTINDLCKFTAARQHKPCAVFATAPSMNGYTSVNAAISEGGLKKSLAAVAPRGVFMDLEVLSAAPVRMIRSGLGDSICRPTAQADWLLSHLIHDSVYRTAPFDLLAEDEPGLLAEPEALLSGDLEAMARLARTLVLSGFGMTLCGGSHPASQGEHLISHYIEMMHPGSWEEAFHGEQIAVTTCVMARLQQQIIDGPPPRLRPDPASEASLIAHFGRETGTACWQEFTAKRLNQDKADRINVKLEQSWPSICESIEAVTIAAGHIHGVLKRAGAPTSFADIGLDKAFFQSAVEHAREIRNRYTFLDLAADSGALDASRLL